MASEDMVGKFVNVDRDDIEWFDKTYTANGAWSHFVRTALRKFRELHDQNGGPDALIELGVRELMGIDDGAATKNS